MFEERAEELRKLIRAVQAFEIPTPVVTDGQPQRIEFTRQNINDMSTIYNTYKRIRGEMGVTASYPELSQQIQLLTPKIQTIMMHYLSTMSQGIGEFDDAASSDFTVDDQTLEAFKKASGLPEEDNNRKFWKAFFTLLDKMVRLDDIPKDRSKQFVNSKSIPVFDELISIADIWNQKAFDTLRNRILLEDGNNNDRYDQNGDLARKMRSMLLHQMAYYWNKRDKSLRNLKLEWVEQLQNGTGEDDQALIKTIKEQCPSLVTGDENKEVVLANIKQAIIDILGIVFDPLIASAITAYDDSFSCTHGILNRLKLNLKTEGLEPLDIAELLLQNMGVMSTYDHSMAPFFSLFADKVVVYDPEQAEFNPGAYANGIFEGVFGDKVIDASWVNDTSVDERYSDMPYEIRAYIKSFQEKVS